MPEIFFACFCELLRRLYSMNPKDFRPCDGSKMTYWLRGRRVHVFFGMEILQMAIEHNNFISTMWQPKKKIRLDYQ